MDIQTIALMLLVGALVILAFEALINIANKLAPRSAIVKELQPYLAQAVFAGQTVALRALEGAEATLTSADRTAIADAGYDALPSMIGPFPISIVKSFVSRDQWRNLVQNVFMDGIAFLEKNKTLLTQNVTIVIPPSPDPETKAALPSRVTIGGADSANSASSMNVTLATPDPLAVNGVSQ